MKIVGAHGRLGEAVTQECSIRHEVFAVGHRELDITNEVTTRAQVLALRPDVIINCAAYNDVDGAEDHALRALRECVRRTSTRAGGRTSRCGVRPFQQRFRVRWTRHLAPR